LTGGNVISIFGEDFPYVDTSDYVQENLVAHYDGINNIGLGDKFHDNNAVIWKNLKSGGVLPDGEVCSNYNCENHVLSNEFNWAGNAFRFGDLEVTDTSWIRIKKPDYSPSEMQLEVVFRKHDDWTGNANNRMILIANYESGGFAMQFHKDYPGYTNNDVTLPRFTTYANTPSPAGYKSVYAPGPFNNNVIYALSGGLENGPVNCVESITTNGGDRVENILNSGNCNLKGPGNTVWAIGANPSGLNISSSGSTQEWLYKTDIYSIRLYSQHLSLEQIAQNAALDQIRYLAAPEVRIGSDNSGVGGLPCTNVAVISATELQCTVPDGTTLGAGNPQNVTVTRDSYSQTLLASEGYTYVNDFYVSAQSTNHGNANDEITFTGNQLNQVALVNIDGHTCQITAQATTTLTCEVPAQTDYNNNTKDIVFSANPYPDLTLQRAWTYDGFINLELTGAGTISLALNPSSQPEDTVDLGYTVDTNNPGGYSVYINTDNSSADYTGHPNDLLCATYATNQYISGLSSPSSSLNTNTWAYKPGGSGTWLDPSIGIQRAKPVVTNHTDPSNPDSSTVTFGAKIDMTQPACGNYTGTVLLTAVMED
jgi:hypothetical protein